MPKLSQPRCPSMTWNRSSRSMIRRLNSQENVIARDVRHNLRTDFKAFCSLTNCWEKLIWIVLKTLSSFYFWNFNSLWIVIIVWETFFQILLCSLCLSQVELVKFSNHQCTDRKSVIIIVSVMRSFKVSIVMERTQIWVIHFQITIHYLCALNMEYWLPQCCQLNNIMHFFK